MNSFAFFIICIIITSIITGIANCLEKMFGIATSTPRNNPSEIIRKAALENAHAYLSPYTDITKNLRLSNTYCSLKLTSDKIIIATEKERILEKTKPCRSFRVIKSEIYSMDEVFNAFCNTFSYNMSYDGLVEICKRLKVQILETTIPPISKNRAALNYRTKNIPKLDVNNCSEIELTELPGINIVMSKRIVKKREEIGGFKSLRDFFLYTKVKPHIQAQLETLITTSPMKGSIKMQKFEERNVDL